LIKYIKSVLWRVAKRLSYIEDARCLKVNEGHPVLFILITNNNLFYLLYTHFYIQPDDGRPGPKHVADFLTEY